MHKRSVGGRLSSNPVRISSIEREERRRTQTLKPKTASSTSENSHIPRPRFRSASVDTISRKSSLKPQAARVQQSQYGAQATAATPSTSRSGTLPRSLCGSSGTLRGRSPSAERASNIAMKIIRKDNRPLGEKSFQAEMLSKIDSYLRSIHQTSVVNNNGSIKPITLKMFVEVSDLLLKPLGIKQPLTMVNYVEELPKIAEKLHYSGQVNKSWLKTANAMHSWPQVLGWLCWLVEVCVVKDLAGEHFQLENLPFIEDDDVGFNEIKFHFLLDAYKAWNEEDANEEATLTEAYLKKVEDAQGSTEEDVENARREYTKEHRLLEDAKAESQTLDNELEQLEESLKLLRNEGVNQKARIKQLEYLKEDYINKTKKTEENTKVLQKTLQQQKIRQEELKVQINSQSMTAVERDEILGRCVDIQNQMRELDKHLKDFQKEVFSVDLKLASTKNNLSKLVMAYNKDIYLHLSKVPLGDLHPLAMPLTGILDPNIMEDLRGKAKLMAALKENIEKQNKDIESTIEADKKKLESLGVNKWVLECKKEEQLVKINENMDKIKNIQDATKAKEMELKESINSLKQKIKDMKDRMPNIEQERTELIQAKEKFDALVKRKKNLEESAKLFFSKMFKILDHQRERLTHLFKESTQTKKNKDK